MRQLGKLWFDFRRSLNDLKRETGFDEAMRDIRRGTEDLRVSPEDWKKDMDPFAGPAKKEPASHVTDATIEVEEPQPPIEQPPESD